MTLTEILAVFDKPSGGSRISDWESLGPDPVLFSWGDENLSIATAILLEETGTVLAVELFTADGIFRWVEEAYREGFFDECTRKGIDTMSNELGLPYIEITEAGRFLDIAGTALGLKQPG